MNTMPRPNPSPPDSRGGVRNTPFIFIPVQTMAGSITIGFGCRIRFLDFHSVNGRQGFRWRKILIASVFVLKASLCQSKHFFLTRVFQRNIAGNIFWNLLATSFLWTLWQIIGVGIDWSYLSPKSDLLRTSEHRPLLSNRELTVCSRVSGVGGGVDL